MMRRLPLTRRAAMGGLAAAAGTLAVPGLLRAQDASMPLGVLTEGDPQAPVTVLEYVSFTCPHCARFHQSVRGDIKRDYIDTGKIKVELREVYFDRVGLWAGMLARCGGADRYFGFVELLFERQREWTAAQDFLAEFKRLGRLGGLDDAQVERCLNDAEAQKALVAMYQEYYQDPLLTGTPTLVVNGAKVDNPTYANLSAAIDAELGA